MAGVMEEGGEGEGGEGKKGEGEGTRTVEETGEQTQSR